MNHDQIEALRNLADQVVGMIENEFETKNERSRESSKLLTYGLTNFDLVQITKANEPFERVDVWLGKRNNVKIYANNHLLADNKLNTKPFDVHLIKDKIIWFFL